MAKTKLEYLQEKKLGPADELREVLSRLAEAHLDVRSMDLDRALAVLQDLDWVITRFDELEARGMDLRSERGRFQGIQGSLEKQAGPLLDAIGGPEVLRVHRPAPPPPPERWWWYINELVATKRQRLMRRVIIGLVVILLIAGGLVLVFNTILAPSPEAIARMNAENDAYLAVEQGDYAGALTVLDEGLAQAPGNPSLLIFKGVVQQALGQEEAATQTFTEVRALMPNVKEFYLARAQLYLRMNQPERAEQDARAALELDEEFARSWLILGQSLEGQNKLTEAMSAYETAGPLAFEHNENEVYVLSRLALARVSQMPPPLPSEEATVESVTPEP
ncbi:MAG: tetratricopeptide repeat protein [Anaerolineae bacterium]|nr:tetratricopeptide repeat protein [Anaerolineae bacterium]